MKYDITAIKTLLRGVKTYRRRTYVSGPVYDMKDRKLRPVFRIDELLV